MSVTSSFETDDPKVKSSVNTAICCSIADLSFEAQVPPIRALPKVQWHPAAAIGAATTTHQGPHMKTSVMEVHDMLSVFSVDEVEKRIGEVPGVKSVTVNFAAKNATVRFDETRLETADIKSAVRLRGHEPVAPVADESSPAAATVPSSSTQPATTANAGEPSNAAAAATLDPAPPPQPIHLPRLRMPQTTGRRTQQRQKKIRAIRASRISNCVHAPPSSS